MTADVELPPLPEELKGRGKSGAIKNYARACVAHATAAKDAEIEALRAAYRSQVIERANEIKLREKAEARAERLAEALRDLLDQLEGVGIYIPDEDSGQWAGTEGLSFAQAEAAQPGGSDNDNDN